MKDPLEDFPYADIINCARPVSAGRSHIPVSDRAAQFMPFDALTGFDEAIAATEQATLQEEIPQLSESELETLSARLQELEAAGLPSCTHTLSYVSGEGMDMKLCSIEAAIRRIDAAERMLYLTSGQEIPFDRLRGVD